jgi:hypothetical protein
VQEGRMQTLAVHHQMNYQHRSQTFYPQLNLHICFSDIVTKSHHILFLLAFYKKINVKGWHSPYHLSACKQWHHSPHEEKL